MSALCRPISIMLTFLSSTGWRVFDDCVHVEQRHLHRACHLQPLDRPAWVWGRLLLGQFCHSPPQQTTGLEVVAFAVAASARVHTSQKHFQEKVFSFSKNWLWLLLMVRKWALSPWWRRPSMWQQLTSWGRFWKDCLTGWRSTSENSTFNSGFLPCLTTSSLFSFDHFQSFS